MTNRKYKVLNSYSNTLILENAQYFEATYSFPKLRSLFAVAIKQAGESKIEVLVTEHINNFIEFSFDNHTNIFIKLDSKYPDLDSILEDIDSYFG